MQADTPETLQTRTPYKDYRNETAQRQMEKDYPRASGSDEWGPEAFLGILAHLCLVVVWVLGLRWWIRRGDD